MDIYLFITILGYVFPTLCEVSPTTTGAIKCPADIPNGTITTGCSRTVSSYCTYWCDYSWCSKRFTRLFCNQYGFWSAAEKACLCEDQNWTRSSTTPSFPTRLSTTTPYPTRAFTTNRDYTTDMPWTTSGQVFVRLADGSGPWTGRVEVYYRGIWGTVCDDSFGVDDAFVICKMLGYDRHRYPVVYQNSYFGQGNGTIIIDELECTGSENSIENCDASWFSHDCSHREDVGIDCFGFTTSLPLSTPGYVAVRLSNGTEKWNGRVEVYYMGIWGTVCDDNFDSDDAFVICSMLEFAIHRYPVVYGNAYFGSGTGPIIIDELDCTGNERSIENCNARWFSHDCSHSEDVGIDCYLNESTTDLPITTPGHHLAVRLSDGSGAWSGRVEVYYFGTWGTVCDDNFDPDDAFVICKMLGYATYRYPMVYDNAYFGRGSGQIIIDELECTGNESSIENCDARWFSHDCSHSEDVGIDCYTPYTTQEYPSWTTRPYTTRHEQTSVTIAPIRCLAFIPNGQMVYSCSRTLYSMCYYSCHSGCSSVFVDLYCNGYGYWDNGEIACKCSGISPATTTTHRPMSTAPPNSLTTVTTYTTTENYVTIRLVNGIAAWNGRVEVYYQGEWGTICDDWFDENDAFVICKMLGLAKYRYPVVYPKAHYGQGRGRIIIDDLRCNGSEATIEDCRSKPWLDHNCRHSEDAGLDCHSFAYLTTTSSWHTSTTSTSETTTTQSSLCPSVIPNGRMSSFCSRRPYNSCRVYCDYGCQSTKAYLYCDTSGTWIHEQTACYCSEVTTTTEVPVLCPEYIPNGRMKGCNLQPFSICFVSCDTGCRRLASFLRCYSSGRWGGADTACYCTEVTTTTEDPVLCPENIPNGRMMRCDLQPLSQCLVSCDTGCRTTKSYLRCDSSGRWLSGDTACNCTVRCPAFIPNGYIDKFCRRLPSSACRYRCNLDCSSDFYYLRCNWNGTWHKGDTACNCKARVLCPKKIDNGHVEDSCSRKDWANCTYDCSDGCDKDPKVKSLLCRNGTWYSARPWTMDTENPCICHPSVPKKTSATIGGILGGAACLVIIWITVCIIAIIRRRKRMANASGSAAMTTTFSHPPPAYSRTRATAPRTAGTTASTQRARVQNGVSSPIYMLSNTVTYQSVQYTASQNSCYLVPEATSSNGTAYPDAPPSYSSIVAAKSEEPPPPPSYEEAVSHHASPTT